MSRREDRGGGEQGSSASLEPPDAEPAELHVAHVRVLVHGGRRPAHNALAILRGRCNSGRSGLDLL